MAEAEGRRATWLADDRLAWALAMGLVVVHLLLGYFLFDPKPFVGGDNAAYIGLAESMSSGQGYRDLYLPDTPRHAQYPPFYPSVLALAAALGGGLITFKVLSLLFTAASVLVLFLLARRRFVGYEALAVAAPFALNPVALYYSHWVLSEAPFVFLTLVALWAAADPDSNKRTAVAVTAALLAYLTRAAGLPLLAALVIALLWRRQWRRLAAVAPPILLVVGGWWAWGRFIAFESARVYSSNFLLVDPYAPERGFVGPGDLLTRTVSNIRLYAVDVLPQSLGGVGPGGRVGFFALMTGLLVIALALIAWFRDIRKVRVLELFMVLYTTLIFVWPDVWTDRRFLLPLLPLILLYAGSGIVWCFDFIRARRRPVWALPVAGALLCLLAVPDLARSVEFNRNCMRFYRQGDELACYPPPWRAFVQTAYWVRDNTPSDAIVVTRKPRLFYYFSGRRGDVYPFTSDDAEMLTFLNGIGADYVVVAGLSQTTFRYLVPAIRSVPERFEPVFRVAETNPPAYVLAYRPPVGAENQRGGPKEDR